MKKLNLNIFLDNYYSEINIYKNLHININNFLLK